MKIDKYKLLGMGATVVGMAVTLISNFAESKTLDSKIAKEVAKALAEKKGK